MSRFWRAETGFFLLLWLFLLVAGRTNLLRDPGTFWHTVAGERMLASGKLLGQDPFTFTRSNDQWIQFEWLGECLMALLHRIDGFDTFLLATATLLASLYTWLAHRLLRSGLHWSLAALLVVLVLAASASHFHARPHLATMVFLGVTFAWLVDFEAERMSLAGLFWLVPIYIFWTSVHGGMLGGLATMLAAFGGWLVWRFLGWPGPLADRRAVIGFAVLIAACGLASLVNPYGVEMPAVWLRIIASGALPEVIQEHGPMDPRQLDGITVLVLAAVFLAVLLNVNRWPRVTWLLPLLWLYETCLHIRHASLFGLTAGLALADMLPHTRWASGRVRSGSDLFVPPPKDAPPLGWTPLLLPVVAVLTALGLQVGRVEVPIVGHGWAQLDPTLWPTELNPQLEELRRSEPDGTRIFNDLNYGGYLIYYTPNLRIFADDRCELHDPRWLKEYLKADAAQIEDWQRHWGFTLALVRTGGHFDDYFRTSPEWTVIRRTETATLYRKAPRSLSASGPRPSEK